MTTRIVESNSVFIHVPRTGGLWFNDLLGKLDVRHQTLKGDYDSHLQFRSLPLEWSTATGFSFIRHPYTWLKSRWSHSRLINSKRDERHFGIHRQFDELTCDSFEETIKRITSKRPGLVGTTFQLMQSGCFILRRTEEIRFAASEFLQLFGGISISPEELKKFERTNSSSSLKEFHKQFKAVPQSLIQEFLESEEFILNRWSSSCRRAELLPTVQSVSSGEQAFSDHT